MREVLVELPVDRLLEVVLRVESVEDLYDFGDVRGARVKPVVYVSEEKVGLVDKKVLVEELEAAGAVHVKTPVVHVTRSEGKRDDRHDVELSIEESLTLFAEETSARDAETKIAFAAALARAADDGDTE